MTKTMLLRVAALGLAVLVAAPAQALQIPRDLDIDALWQSLPGDGYLNFMTPNAFIPITPATGDPRDNLPPGGIATEEHTGWTNTAGADIRDAVDNDAWAGDRADFDWVQEHRNNEFDNPAITNHPGLVGAMGWTIGATQGSPHIDDANQPHDHADLGELINTDYQGASFNVVDVFSIISVGEDEGLEPRDAALDYELWFVDLDTLTSVAGIPIAVYTQGWNPNTAIDDYVVRWRARIDGRWNAIAIEPNGQITDVPTAEIDAIKAATIAEPGSIAVLGFGLMVIGLSRRHRADAVG